MGGSSAYSKKALTYDVRMEKDKRERKVRDEASEGRRLEREVLLMNCKSNTTP